ncbi:DNA-directed RNA polymerase subunit beta [Lactococcus piscium]|uniref:DNA-directed RNA polymerase subunit beta n=1 Tax=Pseudolactococcus carnosus TaxID=2749961 RepID=UPI001FBBDC02|nr:DNA-directed RNA polymerase subunit beta [Lactococcus carnosus]MCJ1996335.1 DNA-directed RNA polymerase subunit beta [Lactococcus carnosus]
MFKKTIKFLGLRISLILLVVILMALAIVLGLMLGYGGLGGKNPGDIFQPSIWHEFFSKLSGK